MRRTQPSPSPLYAPPDVTTRWERLRKSCDACQDAKVKCSKHKPSCHRCNRHRQPCIYSPQRRTGRPRKRAGAIEHPILIANVGSDTDLTMTTRPGAADPSQFSITDAALDPQLLAVGIAAGATDPAFPFPLDAMLDTSLSDQNGHRSPNPFSAHDHDEDNSQHHNHTQNPNPSHSPHEVFGDLSLFLPEDDFSMVPTASQVLEMDQLPPLSVGDSNTSSECDDCGAKCYTMLLQQLLFLRESVPESTRPTIDVILQVEQQARNVIDRILGCGLCGSNRSSMLLLSTITERVIQMLGWIIEEKTLLDTESARSSRQAFRSWARNPSMPPSTGLGGGRRNVCCVPLFVGDTELDEDTKQYFTKQLILTRMKKLAAKLQAVRRTTANRPGDCIRRASELVLVESLQRLDYLRGQVQLWE